VVRALAIASGEGGRVDGREEFGWAVLALEELLSGGCGNIVSAKRVDQCLCRQRSWNLLTQMGVGALDPITGRGRCPLEGAFSAYSSGKHWRLGPGVKFTSRIPPLNDLHFHPPLSSSLHILSFRSLRSIGREPKTHSTLCCSEF
jgi:hypothetical protein